MQGRSRGVPTASNRDIVLLISVCAMRAGARSDAEAAARLSRADLATSLVTEMTGLAGTMGRHYALEAGTAPAVAEASHADSSRLSADLPACPFLGPLSFVPQGMRPQSPTPFRGSQTAAGGQWLSGGVTDGCMLSWGEGRRTSRRA